MYYANECENTMTFQSGDIQDLLTRSRNQYRDPRLDGVWSGLMPDSRLENARNARLLLDRRPCSTYWLLVGRAEGTMSKMSSHTIGTRHLWLFSPEKKWKVLVLPLALQERCCSGQTRLTFLDHVWKAEEKVSSNPARLSHSGWFKGLLLPFSATVSLLVSQPDDGAFIRPAKLEAWNNYWW